MRGPPDISKNSTFTCPQTECDFIRNQENELSVHLETVHGVNRSDQQSSSHGNNSKDKQEALHKSPPKSKTAKMREGFSTRPKES